MLVLTRRPGERLVVPDCDLVVTVLAAEGKAVRLGISAPRGLAVYREEVWQEINLEVPAGLGPVRLLGLSPGVTGCAPTPAPGAPPASVKVS